jgi:hypothetical protein
MICAVTFVCLFVVGRSSLARPTVLPRRLVRPGALCRVQRDAKLHFVRRQHLPTFKRVSRNGAARVSDDDRSRCDAANQRCWEEPLCYCEQRYLSVSRSVRSVRWKWHLSGMRRKDFSALSSRRPARQRRSHRRWCRRRHCHRLCDSGVCGLHIVSAMYEDQLLVLLQYLLQRII